MESLVVLGPPLCGPVVLGAFASSPIPVAGKEWVAGYASRITFVFSLLAESHH